MYHLSTINENWEKLHHQNDTFLFLFSILFCTLFFYVRVYSFVYFYCGMKYRHILCFNDQANISFCWSELILIFDTSFVDILYVHLADYDIMICVIVHGCFITMFWGTGVWDTNAKNIVVLWRLTRALMLHASLSFWLDVPKNINVYSQRK